MSQSTDSRQLSLFDNRLQLELERLAPFGHRNRPLEGILPTGSVTMDAAMGVGGLPRGRMIELYGPPAVGKTTLGLQAIAAAQRQGETAALIDAEHAYDPSYAEQVGVDTESLLVAAAGDGQQAFRIMEKLAASKAVDIILVDSLAAMLTPEEREAAIGEANPFSQCEMIASGLRRLARVLASSPACVLFLNQIRAYKGYGYTETSAGGWSLKLHAAVRADVRERHELRGGKRLAVRVVKNQLAATAQHEFDFAAGIGAVPESELIDMGMDTGVVSVTPRGLVFEGEVLGRNRESAIARIAGHFTLMAELRAAVRAALGLPQPKTVGRAGLERVQRRATGS